MDANGSCCRLATDRLPNEALVALMVAAIDRGTPPCAQVLEEATSVFTAFFGARRWLPASTTRSWRRWWLGRSPHCIGTASRSTARLPSGRGCWTPPDA